MPTYTLPSNIPPANWALSLSHLKPASIYIERNGTTSTTAVEVRIETWVTRTRPYQTEAASTSMGDILIFAPLGTVLKYSDRFVYNSRSYEIVHILPETTHQVQATAKVRD